MEPERGASFHCGTDEAPLGGEAEVLRLHGPQLKAEFTPATGGRYTRWAVVTTARPHTVNVEVLTASDRIFAH